MAWLEDPDVPDGDELLRQLSTRTSPLLRRERVPSDYIVMTCSETEARASDGGCGEREKKRMTIGMWRGSVTASRHQPSPLDLDYPT